MKKIFALMAAFILLTGCDDGEMTFQTFNFSSDNPDLCSEDDNIYISINDSEVLILDFPDDALLNIVQENGDPITDTVNFDDGDLEYRVYNGTPTSSNICGTTTDDPSLSVKERWTGSGTVQVVTSRTIDADTRKITYSHSITILDVSFTKSGETIRIQNNYLGSISKTLSVDFDFNESEEEPQSVRKCDNLNKKYILAGTEALILEFEEDVFGTAADTTVTLDDDGNNSIIFIKYDGNGMSTEGICYQVPASPVELQRWIAEQGTVRIIRTVDGSGDINYDIYLATDVRFFYITHNTGEYFNVLPNFPDSTGPYASYYYLGRYIQ